MTFHDAKGHWGFEEPQNWTKQAVERTAPMAMLLYSLVVLWFVQSGHRDYRPVFRPWYTTKRHASFADMLLNLRTQSLKEKVFQTPLSTWGRKNLFTTLENAMTIAL